MNVGSRAYYNEHDPYAAAWLRNLIAAGHLPAGDVDERSIVDVRPADLRGYAQCHFFAGIGGWAYAARLAGWPDDRPLWTGSCPCQPFSVAGKGKAQADDRHLWPVFFDLIRSCRPAVVMGEQVAAAVGKDWLDGVCADLEGVGYACRAVVVPACAVDAPHRRDRLWFVADAASTRQRDAEDAGAACGGTDASAGQAWQAAGLLEPERGSGARALADAMRGRCSGWPEDAIGSEEQRTPAEWAGGRHSALGHACAPGSSLPERQAVLGAGRRQEGRAATEPGGSPWAAAGWLIGADGKARRVEPGICLLAHGVSGRVAVRRSIGQANAEVQEHWYNRVGALRGLGNAIPPPLAVEIIGAYLDAQPARRPAMTSLAAYHDLIARKRVAFEAHGLDRVPELNAAMFDHQRHSTEFALRAGCSALFLDTGLGKSLCALEWGRVVLEHTNKPVLMLAPLAVAQQHAREAECFGIDAQVVRSSEEMGVKRIYVTNYDRLERFDPARFGGVILDESSVIKSFNGKTTRKLIEAFARTPFRLACTATPAPNDHTELGTHAEFLGVMRREEMLPIWFINDTANTGRWRIKGHARENFWSWVASWARCVSKPSDLGFADDGFELPPLTVTHHEVEADRTVDTGAEKDGQTRLFRIPDTSATSIHKEKRLTIEARAERVAAIVAAEPDQPWIVWVDTDYEADAVMAQLPGAIEVRGSQSVEEKERRLVTFSEGRARIIVTKPVIAGFGLNWQHCARQCFAGISFSYEAWYQAIRRSWRFGQKQPVHVHVVCADTERAIWTVVERKSGDHDAMKREMVAAMRRSMQIEKSRKLYAPTQEATLPAWMVP